MTAEESGSDPNFVPLMEEGGHPTAPGAYNSPAPGCDPPRYEKVAPGYDDSSRGVDDDAGDGSDDDNNAGGGHVFGGRGDVNSCGFGGGSGGDGGGYNGGGYCSGGGRGDGGGGDGDGGGD